MASKRPTSLPGTTDRRIDALLTLLAENSTIVISGAKIAKEIGVTRQQVWRWIEKLRALGVRVQGHPRTGYHIERMPDILVPQMLSHRLYGTPFARRIYHFFKVDSTNSRRHAAGRIGRAARQPSCSPKSRPPAGAAQAARGYRKSPPASIAAILLRPPIPPAHAPLLNARRRPSRARCRRRRSRHRRPTSAGPTT